MVRTETGDGDWLQTDEAVARLGVRPQTLYAYVSRGMVRSERVPGTRRARYARADVERLATRARRRPATGPEIVVDSAITQLDPAGHLSYRGWDATRAAREASYEQVAEWLWDTGHASTAPWIPAADALRVGRKAQQALPATAGLTDRIRVVVAAIAACDPLRNDRRPASVAARARALIATMVDALPITAGARQPAADASIAARLWARVSALEPIPTRVATLDLTLVLLADHELAASTLAARVAASTWADPYLVVLAGLAAAGGPLHGGASDRVRILLAEVVAGTPADVAIGARLADSAGIPGAGHGVYEGPDPRADALLEAIRRTRPPRALLRASAQIAELVSRDGGPHPNIDFALGLLAESAEMVPGAGDAIFSIARTAGWIAHGLEEYPHRLRYRIRAAYTGEPPEGT